MSNCPKSIDIIGPEDCELSKNMMNRLTVAGAKKHGVNSWLDKNNPSLESIANFGSCSRHLAKAVFGPDPYDGETEVLHYIAIAWRAMAKAERILRNIDKR